MQAAKPGPKKKETHKDRRTSGKEVLGLAAAVSSLMLSPVANRSKPKPAKNGGKGKGSKGKGRGRALAPTDSEENVADEEADAISQVPENEIPQEDDLGERPAGAGKIKRRRRLARLRRAKKSATKDDVKEHAEPAKKKKAKPAKNGPMDKTEAEEKTGEKRKCMDSFLAKQWLSFRKTELDRMKAASDPRSYHDKLKDIASRHGCSPNLIRLLHISKNCVGKLRSPRN